MSIPLRIFGNLSCICPERQYDLHATQRTNDWWERDASIWHQPRALRAASLLHGVWQNDCEALTTTTTATRNRNDEHVRTFSLSVVCVQKYNVFFFFASVVVAAVCSGSIFFSMRFHNAIGYVDGREIVLTAERIESRRQKWDYLSHEHLSL